MLLKKIFHYKRDLQELSCMLQNLLNNQGKEIPAYETNLKKEIFTFDDVVLETVPKEITRTYSKKINKIMEKRIRSVDKLINYIELLSDLIDNVRTESQFIKTLKNYDKNL